MLDCHIHIERGEYTLDWINQFVQTAKEKRLDEIWLLKHCYRFREFVPMYDDVCEYSDYIDKWFHKKAGELDLSDYLRLVEKIRQKDAGITIKFGLEVCYFKEFEDFVYQNTKNSGFKIRPLNIIPIITNLAHLRVDDVTRLGYLNPLIEKAKIYSDDFWLKPQWIHISDLEKLAALAEEGVLDIEKLLIEKNSKYMEMQFDDFLYKQYNSKFVLKKLFGTATEFLKNAKEAFWPSGYNE